jgi:cytosine/adenosine deaminase-related metal-dependent hydrolase
VPVNRAPIGDGAVMILGERIAGVGRWRDLSRESAVEVLDLGDVAVIPGLVNAHCHLDYTDMAGQLLPPKLFTDWLKLILVTKAGWSQADFAHSWRHGAEMLVRSGTTTVADIEAVPELLPEAWNGTPLRVMSFLEITGIRSRREPRAILQEAAEQLGTLQSPRCRPGLSPHAPYSTLPELLRLSARTASRRKWRLATHVAESALEFEMFSRARGDMFDWLQRSGRDMSDCGRGSPVQHMARCGMLGGNLLAVHVNYLGNQDAALLARNKTHVVHCPRSHSYFKHDKFPLRRLRRAGVNICLGTDSLVSVYKTRRQTVVLNMFDEMRELAAKEPGLAAKTILEMATMNGARALGMDGKIGELSERAFADLVCIPYAGKTSNVHEGIMGQKGTVAASMIGGQWAIQPGTQKPGH